MIRIVCFISGMIVAYMMACSTGPKVTIYISNPAQGGMDYYDENTSQAGFTTYALTDKFVCLNPTDMQAMISYCGVKGSK